MPAFQERNLAQTHAFLIRIWTEATGLEGNPVWRCSLENVQTRQRLGFDSPAALCIFLERTLNEPT